MNKSYFKKGHTPWNKGKKLGKVIYSNYIDSRELFKKLHKIFLWAFVIDVISMYIFVQSSELNITYFIIGYLNIIFYGVLIAISDPFQIYMKRG